MPLINVWNGSSWTQLKGWLKPRVWNGSQWVRVKPKLWTGSGWGTVSVPQSRTVTVGNLNFAGDKFSPAANYYGYSSANSFGSMSDTSLALWEGGIITELFWDSGTNQVSFNVSAQELVNGRFTTLTINGTAFSRSAAATYGTNPTGFQYWRWNTATNPFGTSGVKTVSWT